MEVHRQQCQACGAYDCRVVLAREADLPTRVYVRCVRCRELVACYVLGEYYHHGKGIESYLRSHGVGAGDSGRQWLEAFERLQRESVEGWERVRAQLEADGKSD